MAPELSAEQRYVTLVVVGGEGGLQIDLYQRAECLHPQARILQPLTSVPYIHFSSKLYHPSLLKILTKSNDNME